MILAKRMVVSAVLAVMAVGAQAAVWTNDCDSLAEWQDNSSGMMSIETGGPSGTYLKFVGLGGATLTLRPNIESGNVGVDVLAGEKLCFDAKVWRMIFPWIFPIGTAGRITS